MSANIFTFLVVSVALFDIAKSCLDFEPFDGSELIFDEHYSHISCMPLDNTTFYFTKLTKLKIDPQCVRNNSMTIDFKIILDGNKDCSGQEFLYAALEDGSTQCPFLHRCHGYNLTFPISDKTFCRIKCAKQLSDENRYEVQVMHGAHALDWDLCSLKIVSESLPDLLEAYGEGNYQNHQHQWWGHMKGMFFIDSQYIKTALGSGLNVLVYDPEISSALDFKRFDMRSDSAATEAALLRYINLIPDGSIVMAGIWDTGEPCGSDCQQALSLIGGTGQPIGHRESFALIGYKGEICGLKPDWVTEVREPYTTPTVTAVARVEHPSLPDCD